jgi:hypothetical protein
MNNLQKNSNSAASTAGDNFDEFQIGRLSH